MLMKLSKKPRDRQIMYSRILNPLDKIQVLRKKIIKVKLLPKMKRLIPQNINRTFCLGKSVTQIARFKASFMDLIHLLILMLLSSAFFKN